MGEIILQIPSSLCATSYCKVTNTKKKKNAINLQIFYPYPLASLFLSLPNKFWGTYCFCSVSYYYFYFYYYYSYSFFPRSMNLSTADLRIYRTEFHETWWSYRYMFLVDPKVFRFVVKVVKAIFLEVQRGWGLL